jgi:hypothetical protein
MQFSPVSSLADQMALLLDRAQVPIPGGALQTLAAIVRDAPVPSPRLARIAAFERERYVRKPGAPRLCVVLDEDGLELRPRVWARGVWRLARRVRSPDAVAAWDCRLALLALELSQESSASQASEVLDLGRMAAERALGPLATGELESRLLTALRNWDAAGATTQQTSSEESLRRDPSFSSFESYFGRTRSKVLSPKRPPDLRTTGEDEEGVSFARLVATRAGGIDRAAEILAYIQEWAELRDQLGQVPDRSQYAQRYGCDLSVVSTRARLFRRAFPREIDPARIVDFLKCENPRALFTRALTMPVVDLRAVSHPPVDVFVADDRTGRWAVWTNERLRSSHKSKAEAVAAARLLARSEDGVLHIADRSRELIRRDAVSAATPDPVSFRRRAASLFQDAPNENGVLVQVKSTNWDALPRDRAIDNARRHANQILEMSKRQGATREVSALILQYPQRPSTPGLAEEIEAFLTRSGCEVLWGDSAPASAPAQASGRARIDRTTDGGSKRAGSR